MNELEFLKQEEKLCGQMWDENYQESNGNGVTLNHVHICDFDLINLLYRGKMLSEKSAKEKCKQYLKSIGKERDEDLECCDHCIHDRYVTISEDNTTVLNICTIGTDARWK